MDPELAKEYKEKREELGKLNPGELVLLVVDHPNASPIYVSNLNLGILSDKPQKDGLRVTLPMNKCLQRTISISIEQFEQVGTLADGFHKMGIAIYSENLSELYKQVNRWEERKCPIEIGSFDYFDFFNGEDVHKKFWHPGVFENQSGLDLSYVFALKSLGAQIPKNIYNQYQQDFGESESFRRLIMQNLKEREKVWADKEIIDSIFLKKSL